VSKSSIVTTRRTPVQPATEEKAAGFVLTADTVVVQTEARIELVDLTAGLADFVRASRVREGVLSVWSLHTTCAIFINEAQTALHADIKRVLEQIIERDAEWMHNDPEHSDCDRFNADAHLRAMLLGHSLTLQVSGGELVLGQWQRVLAAELDGPRARTIRLQAMRLA
jgi:secondary thiamine-phosphate synthase enzyme